MKRRGFTDATHDDFSEFTFCRMRPDSESAMSSLAARVGQVGNFCGLGALGGRPGIVFMS